MLAWDVPIYPIRKEGEAGGLTEEHRAYIPPPFRHH